VADDLQKFNFGSWAESIAGSVARNWAKNKFMPKQPKMDYYFDKQFDQAKQDMTRTIAENLSKRGMSGATDITAEALRPVSDLEAQRAYLRGQVDYQNDMQDYNDKAQFWGEIIPTLFSYEDSQGAQRMGPITGMYDEAANYVGNKMPVIDGFPNVTFDWPSFWNNYAQRYGRKPITQDKQFNMQYTGGK
jgi:hypothetical protein